MEKKEPSPISVVWGWAEKYHSKFYGSVVLAVLGVAGTMLAYFSIAAMIRILLENGDFSQCLPWCGFLLFLATAGNTRSGDVYNSERKCYSTRVCIFKI